MKLILIILLTLSFNANAIKGADKAVFDLAKYNFTYKSDVEDEHKQYKSIGRSFEGDCEDFALTLQSAFGGDLWLVHVKGQGFHVVTVKKQMVYDNMYEKPIHISDYVKMHLVIRKYEPRQDIELINNYG